MEAETLVDTLGFNSNQNVKKLALGDVGGENIIFSINVMRVSKWQQNSNVQLFISQSGTIFISQLEEDGQMTISRKIQIMSLQALTLLETEKLQQQYRSFVLHHKT